MSSRVADKLSQHWAAQLAVSRGATSESVEQFEATHHVTLPAEMRDYFLELDGMGSHWPNDQDAKGFSFWPLALVRPAAEELSKMGMESPPELDRHFAFADYLGLSWAYAIRLTDDPLSGNRVMLIGKDSPVQVASSFGEFVDLYLQDSPRLYGQVN